MSAADEFWCQQFEARVGDVMRGGGLSHDEAERAVLEAIVVAHLNASCSNSDPGRCAHCGLPEASDAALSPIGAGTNHVWVHSNCWEPWRAERRAEVIDQLARLGIVKETWRKPSR